MMIVYSTEPGKVALDGTGHNSAFTAALLRHIDTQGEKSICDVMIDVRNDVLSATGGKRHPFERLRALASSSSSRTPPPKPPRQIAAKELASNACIGEA